MQKEEEGGGGGECRPSSGRVVVGLVTCALFPHLTGDDRHLHRALLAALTDRSGPDEEETQTTTKTTTKKKKTTKKTTKGRHASTEAPSPKDEDFDETNGPVRIVQWTDPSVDWDGMGLCVVRTPWDYTQKYAQWEAWLESTVRPSSSSSSELSSSTSTSSMPSSSASIGEGRTRFLPDYVTLKWNGHKRYLLDLERRGIPVVPTRLVERGQSLEKTTEEIARRNEWRCDTLVVKPAVGSFGNDVMMIKLAGNSSDNVKVMKRLNQMLHEQDLLVQPFLASVKTKGEVSLIFIDNQYVHAIKKKPIQGEFKVQGGKIDRHSPTEEELELARATLYAAIEAIYTPYQCTRYFTQRVKSRAEGEQKSGSQKGKGARKQDAGQRHAEVQIPRAGDPSRRLLFARIDLLCENDGSLLVSEVEVLDPELFLRLSPICVERLTTAILSAVQH